MANKDGKKTIETITHEEARRKNIPTAEFQSVMGKEEQYPIRVAMPRGVAGLEEEKAGRNRDLDPQLIWRGKNEQDGRTWWFTPRRVFGGQNHLDTQNPSSYTPTVKKQCLINDEHKDR
jgi:hypothetical protein